MKKVKYLLLIIFILLYTDVKAINNCSNDDMNRLRNLANNIEFKQELVLDNLDEDDKELTDYVDVSYKLSIINSYM